MPAYYDEKTKSWYCKFYYTDYTGTKKQKKKRGFKLQREAKEWERNFLETQQADLSMTFENFVKIYNEDMKHRLREHTFIQKQYVINKKLLPFFGKIPVSQITPAHVRKWQNILMAYRDENDKPYSETYLRTYTGLRIGELLALEYGDIDFKGCTINVNKSYQHINGKDVVTPPKTPKSVRIVSIPEFLRDEIKNYTERLYGLHKHDRIFPYTKSFFEHEMIRGTKDGEVKRIRLHDIRHSHASLLIEMGFSALAVADRLGHEKVETTLNTYSHLFPHKRDEVAEKLQKLK